LLRRYAPRNYHLKNRLR